MQSAVLAIVNPSVRPSVCLLVRERSPLSDPYCHSAWNSVCLFVGVFVRNFEVKYLENQRS